MTYKQIETAREIRLWVGQIIVPAVVTASTLMAVPEVRQGVKTTIKNVKEKIDDKITRSRIKKVES